MVPGGAVDTSAQCSYGERSPGVHLGVNPFQLTSVPEVGPENIQFTGMDVA